MSGVQSSEGTNEGSNASHKHDNDSASDLDDSNSKNFRQWLSQAPSQTVVKPGTVGPNQALAPNGFPTGDSYVPPPPFVLGGNAANGLGSTQAPGYPQPFLDQLNGPYPAFPSGLPVVPATQKSSKASGCKGQHNAQRKAPENGRGRREDGSQSQRRGARGVRRNPKGNKNSGPSTHETQHNRRPSASGRAATGKADGHKDTAPAGTAGQDLNTPGLEDPESRTLKTSGRSDPKRVAGAISHIARRGQYSTLLATGADSINQAIKAIAIARDYVDESKLELSCFASLRKDKRGGLRLEVRQTSRRAAVELASIEQLRVSKDSAPVNVAGAIANKLRDNLRVTILAIGAECVSSAAKSISLARQFLEQNAMDVGFRPRFTRVTLEDGRDRSAILFTLLAQQV